MKKSHWIFSVSCLSQCVSEWCHACGRLSLMENNVDTSHPRNCSQLTCCLIKVIYWFIYGRMKVIAKWVHAALTSPEGLVHIFPKNHLSFFPDTLDGSTATIPNSTSDCFVASEISFKKKKTKQKLLYTLFIYHQPRSMILNTVNAPYLLSAQAAMLLNVNDAVRFVWSTWWVYFITEGWPVVGIMSY